MHKWPGFPVKRDKKTHYPLTILIRERRALTVAYKRTRAFTQTTPAHARLNKLHQRIKKITVATDLHNGFV